MAREDESGGGEDMTLPHLVKWAEMAVRAQTERAMRDMPVSGSQLLVLVLLQERREATSAEIARMLRLTPQAMTTLLGPLRQAGYLERRADIAHARRLPMRLTPEGTAVIAAARRLGPAIEDDILDGFTPAERLTLKRLLGRIARRLD